MCAREIVKKCKEDQVIDNLISKKTTNADILDCISSLPIYRHFLWRVIFTLSGDRRLMMIFFLYFNDYF